MTPHPWAPRPNAGDIVQCRFPQQTPGAPGPKERPGLVLEVEEDPQDASTCIVRVAYGTSHNVHQCYPGEFTVLATDPKAGLSQDTKFDLGHSVRLPFDDMWFAQVKGGRFGIHPKRGFLNTKDAKIKRALHAALTEAKAAGRL